MFKRLERPMEAFWNRLDRLHQLKGRHGGKRMPRDRKTYLMTYLEDGHLRLSIIGENAIRPFTWPGRTQLIQCPVERASPPALCAMVEMAKANEGTYKYPTSLITADDKMSIER